MKKARLTILIILAVLLIVLVIYILNGVTPKSGISTEEGKYYDIDGNVIGNCMIEVIKSSFSSVETFYNANGDLIGNCTSYVGPGSSGGWKGGCSSGELLEERACRSYECDSVKVVKEQKYNCIGCDSVKMAKEKYNCIED